MALPEVYPSQLPLFVTEKRCSTCGELKPLSEYHTARKAKDGLMYACKICVIAATHAYAAKRKEQFAAEGVDNNPRRCARCKVVKDADEFYIASRMKGGRAKWCKACLLAHRDTHRDEESERTRKWAEEHPERVKQRHQEYYIANRERAIAASREYHRANRDSALVRQRAYYERHRAKMLEQSKEYRLAHHEEYITYGRNYYQHNRDRSIQKAREWANKNPERHRMTKRIARHRRRVRLAKAGGSFTVQDVLDLFEAQQGLCAYCATPLTDYQIDHKVAIARGGSNHPENLALACPPCNRRKSARAEEDFRALLASGVYD